MTTTVFANDKTEIELLNKKTTYNDKPIQFLDTNNKPIYPVYAYGDVYLPICSIANMIGKDVKYDKNTKSIYMVKKNLL